MKEKAGVMKPPKTPNTKHTHQTPNPPMYTIEQGIFPCNNCRCSQYLVMVSLVTDILGGVVVVVVVRDSAVVSSQRASLALKALS